MATISVNGVGFSGTIEVEEGESYADALTRAGFSEPDELNIHADGTAVEPTDTVQGTPQVTATPKNAALGS